MIRVTIEEPSTESSLKFECETASETEDILSKLAKGLLVSPSLKTTLEAVYESMVRQNGGRA